MKACAKQLGGCWAKHPRQRHLSVTDNERYVYLIGSQYKSSSQKVERYDCQNNLVDDMADLNFEFKPGHWSACFFDKNKLYKFIYLLANDNIHQLTIGPLSNKWANMHVQFSNQITKRGMT